MPQTRAERIGRLGSLVAGIAGEAALETLRRAVRKSAAEGSVLLTPAAAERIARALAELRGAAMKLGQLISLPGEELLPPALSETLAALRNRADPMPPDQLAAVLESELGADWRVRVREFDFEPLAAASIGQVHAAEAADGRDLALKIQYPGVARSIDGDVDNLATLLRVSRLLPADLDLDALVPELKRELRLEVDYRREADSAERFGELVADDPRLFVPRVHRDLSTRRVLALERVWALPIEDLRGPEHPRARRDRLADALVRHVFRELFEFRFMQTDPNFANYLYEPKGERVALLDFGATRSFAGDFTRAYGGLVAAASDGTDADVVAAGELLGFLRGDDTREAQGAFLSLARLFAEPLRARRAYDFAASDLAVRLRDRSLAVYQGGWLPRPPPATLFLHRKLVGSFLLCAHIGARVDCRAPYRALVQA